MKSFLVLMTALTISMNTYAQDMPCCEPKYLNEIGLVFPVNPDVIKNYVNANSIDISPLTSGFGTGFQIGRHRVLNEKATLGIVMGGNAFITSGTTTSQIYQANLFLTGRLYFGSTWRNGVFAEVGTGPEFAASSVQGSDFGLQANIASRIGVGYNYQFNKNVTLGISVIASPSLTAGNYTDGARVVANMLW